MTNRTTSTFFAALLTATFSLAAVAADPVPTATSAAASGTAASNVDKPVIGPRVGGSPADAEFREAIQKSGADFRTARKDCRAKASEERRSCIDGARHTMQAARAEAKARHDAAVREARAARK